jgi:hypothetical protein
MPKAADTLVVLELTPYSFRALRATGGSVEAGGECVRENKAAIQALLASVIPAGEAAGFKTMAGLWPASSTWHMATDTEAMLDRSSDAIRVIAAGKLKTPGSAFGYAACNTGDGAAVKEDGMEKWVLAFSPLESLAQADATLEELKVEPDSVSPSAFAAAGAAAGITKASGGESVILWDIGAEASSLVQVGAAGVEAVAPCAVGMDRIFEYVQTALKLKFRGASERLFFNDTYDFSEAGAKIASQAADAFKEALALLPSGGARRLACPALSSKQAWFVKEMSTAVGLAPWEPDLAAHLAKVGISFADPAIGASFPPSSAGLFTLLASHLESEGHWTPDWQEAEAAPVEVPPEPEPEVVPEPEPEPTRPAPAPPGRTKPSMSIGQASSPPPKVTRPPFPASGAHPPAPAPGAKGSSMRPPMPAGSPRPPGAPSGGRPPVPPPAARPPPVPVRAPAPEPSAFPEPGATTAPFPEPGATTAPFPEPGATTAPFPDPGTTTAPFLQAGTTTPPFDPARPVSFSNPAFPVPGATSAPFDPAKPQSFSNPPVPAPAQPQAKSTFGKFHFTPPPAPGAVPEGGTTPPMGSVTSLPFNTGKLKSGGGGVTQAPFAEAPPPKSKVGLYVGISVVGAILFAVTALLVESRLEKIKANDLRQQQELARQVEEEQQKAAAQQVEQEKEKEQELEHQKEVLAQQVAEAKREAAESTRKQVMAEVATQQAAARAPGVVTVSAQPDGAAISIDGGLGITSPARFQGVAPGTHNIKVTLDGYETADVPVTVAPSKTSDLGTITLIARFGSLSLTSTPSGLDFAIRPAGAGISVPIRSGRTPATIDRIIAGDYSVTFTRPGIRDHVVPVTVERGQPAAVDTKYVNGSLELSSDPTGANVTKDGMFLGTTPLVLHDLTPRSAKFELTLPGYDPTPITCDIPEGQTLRYSADILRRDRVFKPSEVGTPPKPLDAPQPVLSAAQLAFGADIVISAEVRRDGSVVDVTVATASDDDVARRCAAAVEKWRYQPATAPDGRIVDSMVEIPFKYAAQSQ